MRSGNVMVTGYRIAPMIFLCLALGASMRVMHGRANAQTDEPGVVLVTRRLGDARHPEISSMGSQAVLFWCGKPERAAARYYGPFIGPLWEWPIYGALLPEQTSVREVRASAAIRFPMVRGWPERGRIGVSLDNHTGSLLGPRHSGLGFEIAVHSLTVRREGPKVAIELGDPPHAVLPQVLPDVKHPAPDHLVGPERKRWFLYTSLPLRSLQRLDLEREMVTRTYYLCGQEHETGTVWITQSRDLLQWRALTTLAKGPGYPAVAAHGRIVIVTYTASADKSRPFMYQNLWPDDLAPRPSGERPSFVPDTGALRYRLSRDAGSTWEGEKTVDVGHDVIQSRCAIAPDGTIWVAYVKEGPKQTTICLIHSTDEGKTWSKPEEITSGEYLDRDVDIAVHNDRLYVAFSRCRWAYAPTSIWVWSRELGARTQRGNSDVQAGPWPTPPAVVVQTG